MSEYGIRALRFYAVGAIGIAVQLTALWLLRSKAGVGLTLATSLAVEAAVLHNFAWHERWTWRDRPAGLRERLARLAKFHLTNGAISFGGNLALMKLLHDGLGLHYLVANALSIAACSVANYLASEFLVFRPSRSRISHDAVAENAEFRGASTTQPAN